MSALGHYVHLHLAASAAGIDLFGRSAPAQLDPEVARVVAEIRDELPAERQALQRMADELGVGESVTLTSAARLGEKVGRLKPNDSLLHRTPLTDLVEVEGMRDAVWAKLAGWQALLEAAPAHDALDEVKLRHLAELAQSQIERLDRLHRLTASRALGVGAPPTGDHA